MELAADHYEPRMERALINMALISMYFEYPLMKKETLIKQGWSGLREC